jgi:outer membrane phospholipase A
MPMRLRTATFLALLLAAAPVRALELSLAPVEREIAAGAAFSVVLTAANDGADTVEYAPPPRLDLRVIVGDSEQTASLVAAVDAARPVSIPPGGFARVVYTGPAPSGLIGDIVLRPVNLQANAVAIHLLRGAEPANEVSRLTSALSAYEPIYFSIGSRGNTNARFQISLKFRVFNPETRTPFLEKLYLAYSQTSLWDLESSSKPFRDSSYRPSVFFLDDNVSQWPLAHSRLGFQAGLEHESNGKDGAFSRSINTAFVRPALTFPLGGDYQLTLAPKIYHYIDKDENPDIDDYRGNVDFLVRLGREDGWQLDTTLRRGRTSSSGSVQVDASYPLRIATFGNLGGYLHLQYFNGYGESLVDYNVKLRSQFRIGLMVTRGLRW